MKTQTLNRPITKRRKRKTTAYAKRYQPNQISKVRNDGIVIGVLVTIVILAFMALLENYVQ